MTWFFKLILNKYGQHTCRKYILESKVSGVLFCFQKVIRSSCIVIFKRMQDEMDSSVKHFPFLFLTLLFQKKKSGSNKKKKETATLNSCLFS